MVPGVAKRCWVPSRRGCTPVEAERDTMFSMAARQSIIDTSMCCPEPPWRTRHSAMRTARAAWAEPTRNACAPGAFTGGADGLPLTYMSPPMANATSPDQRYRL